MARMRQAWRLRIRPGQEAEYRARHAAVWPEVLESLRREGMLTFSIVVDGLDVFLYCEIDPDLAAPAATPAVPGRNWHEFMSDVLEPRTERRRLLAEVFHYERGSDPLAGVAGGRDRP